MVFSSTVFLFIFLPAVLLVYFNPIIKSRSFKNNFLFFVSLIFYAWGEPAFVLVMLLSILVNWLFGLLVARYAEKRSKALWVVAFCAIFNIGILFIFKYLDFALKNIGWLINRDMPSFNIALPIGISFFTFQAMSYVLDLFNNRVKAQKSLFSLGLYISCFPQLIAGPIVRYETIEDEIENRTENFTDFSDGCVRFIQGLAKKAIIANNMAVVADVAFATPLNELSTAMSWLGVISYTFQIYFDFSGYSDMAIGLGRMFGFHFRENFDHPYIASSISDFWRRWHISLSSWFRDYVYIPLGGSFVDTRFRQVTNLFIVWLLTGIWHGANWTFIAWGLLHFSLIVFEKVTSVPKKLGRLSNAYTMFFVMISWVVFRSDNLSDAFKYLLSMVGFNNSALSCDAFSLYASNYKVYFVVALLACFPLNTYCLDRLEKESLLNDFLYAIATLAVFVLTITFIIRGSYNPFIYFNF